jgi:hypothetical protein
MIKLDNCCIPCIITSEKSINKKIKVSDLKAISSTRNKDKNKYSPLEVCWILYPEEKKKFLEKLRSNKTIKI